MTWQQTGERRSASRPCRRRSAPSPRPAAAAGLTVVELLIVVAVIGLITAFVIPNFLVSLDKAKQKRTMVNIHDAGKAFMMWLTDQSGAAAAGGRTVSLADYGPSFVAADLEADFVPRYLPVLPDKDGWGNPIEFYLNTADLEGNAVMAIRSPGRDGAFSGDSYDLGAFTATDFDQDLVWADGIFITWPQGRAP